MRPNPSTRRGIACLRTRRGGVNDPAGLPTWLSSGSTPPGRRGTGGWLCPHRLQWANSIAPMCVKKTPRGRSLIAASRGRGPEPHSSGRGVITLRKERCCLRLPDRQRYWLGCGRTVRPNRGPASAPVESMTAPRVTSGGQKTGCRFEPRSPRLDHRRSWWTCTAKGCQEQGSAGLE